MAIYRLVQMAFWTDAKVVDEFTPEDKFFYLYLLTNIHTNLCGCYEISLKQMSDETGYTKETVQKLIDRMEHKHDVIRYSRTKEMLILNWHKHNWTSSDRFRKPLLSEIEQVKDSSFKSYLTSLFNGEDVRYGIDTNCIDTTIPVTDTDTVTDAVSVKEKKPKKQRYGEYKHVLLTDAELQKLTERFPNNEWHRRIQEMDEAIERKGYKYNSHYLAILDWARRDEKQKQSGGFNQFMSELERATYGE